HTLELPRECELLFTDNETNAPRVFGPWAQSRSRWVKDAFHRRIIEVDRDAVNPERTGTKACGWVRVEIDGGSSYSMTMRLGPAVIPSVSEGPGGSGGAPPAHTDPSLTLGMTLERRKQEADEFYASIH